MVPILLFLNCCSLHYSFLYLLFRVDYFGVSDGFMAVFQMSLDDYPQCTLGEDGFLWTTG
jgi:hypothetical protein